MRDSVSSHSQTHAKELQNIFDKIQGIWNYIYVHKNGEFRDSCKNSKFFLFFKKSLLMNYFRKKICKRSSTFYFLRNEENSKMQPHHLSKHLYFDISAFTIDEILTTARRDGNVLIVVDTAGRVLELSQLLVKHKNSLVYVFCLHVCILILSTLSNQPEVYLKNNNKRFQVIMRFRIMSMSDVLKVLKIPLTWSSCNFKNF